MTQPQDRPPSGPEQPEPQPPQGQPAQPPPWQPAQPPTGQQAPWEPAPWEPAQSTPAPTAGKRLLRSREDRWLAGVCGGIAEYTGVDANLVRLLVVLGTVLGFGSLLIAYVAAWIIVPEA